jgi:hypothetical protein
MSDTALATVTEAQADPATAAIFTDIRDTMGIALVNLIWRHLAVSPAALSWSWHTLKPLYASGIVPQAAWTLRQTLTLPEFDALNEQDRLAVANEDLDMVDAVLRTYERGNAQNLVALCALRLVLTNMAGNAASEIAERTSACTATVDAVDAEQAEREDRVTEVIPPLPAMAQLSAEIRADVESLAEVWVPAQHRGMIPSVFRHLAHWPTLLAIYRCKLHAPPSTQPEITELADRAIAQATLRATALIAQLGPAAPLDSDTQDWLGSALDLFIDGMIGRGTVLVPAMRKILRRQPG